MKLFSAFCVLTVVCAASGAPDVANYDLLEGPNRDVDVMLHTKQLITQLVENLHKSAQEALNSVTTFKAGLANEVKEIREKIISDVQKFKQRVKEAVENVMNRISSTNVAVKNCVDSHRNAAAVVFNETVSSTMTCVDECIAKVSKEIQELVTIANEAMATSTEAMEDMKKCTGDKTNFWAAGSCFKAIAVKTEMKSFSFLWQSTMTIGRINLDLASLPASFDVCAGKRLIQTGIQTGKLIVEVGGCSATGIFNTIIGKPTHVEK